MTRSLEILATVLFAVAILHTFMTSLFQSLAHRSPKGSIRYNLFHILGEVEVVFGIWGTIFVLAYALTSGSKAAIAYIESVDFTEAAFVFVIMAVAATRSIRYLTSMGIGKAANAVSKLIPSLSVHESFFLITLIFGPLLGSLITEPAAMTVCALILRERFFSKGVSSRFKYKTIGLLFVNISIGGVLTHFAAPPVVMVAKAWGWNTPYMFTNFGYQAIIAVILNTLLTHFLLRKELKELALPKKPLGETRKRVPTWVTLIHIIFLALVVYTAHHMAVFIGIFLLFIGVIQITEPHQDPVHLRESMLVGFFLGGLFILGKPQSWWLSPLLQSLSEVPLFFGALALGPFTDNAALTFLGSQVPNLSDGAKHALVAGAVTSGGLTIIANAPNPAGYGILKPHFGERGVEPLKLALGAFFPTVIAAICFKLF